MKSISHLTEIPAKGKVVIDFSATWCGPCKKIAPVFENLSKKHPDISFFKTDVDEAEAVANKYKVEAMPTFIFINNGKIINRLEGADQKSLEQFLVELSNL